MAGEEITLAVLADRMTTNAKASSEALTDIRDNMVRKDVYKGDLERIDERVAQERADRIEAQGQLKIDLLERITTLAGTVKTNKEAADTTAAAVANRRSTLQNGIILALVGAAAAGVVGVLVAVLNAAAHLS